MSRASIGTSHQVCEYLRIHASEPEVLRRVREEASHLPEANLQISPEQGRFMAWLVEVSGARRCVEIGVFTGYSSLAVALALPEDGKLLACDSSERWTRTARRHWEEAGVASKIELCVAPAAATLEKRLAAGEQGTYDFAFIDADKESSDLYYEYCLALLRPGGLVLLDNALWDGRVADESVTDPGTIALRALNEKARSDPRVSSSLVPIGDGLLLARKR